MANLESTRDFAVVIRRHETDMIASDVPGAERVGSRGGLAPATPLMTIRMDWEMIAAQTLAVYKMS